MTTPDLACMFCYETSTLVSGWCLCVFHLDCAAHLNVNNDGVFVCPRCHVTNTKWKPVTGRNCLACQGYTNNVFCRSCHVQFVTEMQKRCMSQTQINLLDYVNNIFFENKLTKHFWPLFTAWLLLQLQHDRSLVCFYKPDVLLYHPPVFLLAVWKRTAAQHGVLDLVKWKQHVHPMLKVMAPYTDADVALAQDEVTLFHKDLAHKEQKITLKNVPTSTPVSITFPVLHRTLVKLKLTAFIHECVKQEMATKLFLSHANETMYYLSFTDATPIISKLAERWLQKIHLHE